MAAILNIEIPSHNQHKMLSYGLIWIIFESNRAFHPEIKRVTSCVVNSITALLKLYITDSYKCNSVLLLSRLRNSLKVFVQPFDFVMYGMPEYPSNAILSVVIKPVQRPVHLRGLCLT